MLSKIILAASLALLGAGGFSARSALTIQRAAYQAPILPTEPVAEGATTLR